MDRLFEDFFNEGPRVGQEDWFGSRAYPALNIWEDDRNLYAEAELPGLGMDDVEVLTTANELTLKGQRKPHEDEKVAYHRQERTYGTFNRRVRLPVDIDSNKVDACMKDGVLLITMPKAETARLKRIQVKSLTG